MLHLNFTALILLVSTWFSPPSTPEITLEEGLIAYYSFNECDARDDSGNGCDGVLFGGVRCWCGIEDDGLLFDGANDFVEFHGAVNDNFNTTDFTISFYFKPEQQGVFKQSLLGKRPECNDFYMFDLMLDTGNRKVDTRVHETPEKCYDGISPDYESAGWQHFALVREGFRATTYINGQPKHSGFRCSGVDITNDAPLTFSHSPCLHNGYAQRFKGVLDELRIYDRALSNDEIAALYARNPIENATQDCFTQGPQKPGRGCPHPQETDYLCAL